MTTYVVYSFGGTVGTIIDSFNSSTTITRQQCDDFAISRAARVSTPLQMQGVCNYTVTAGPNKSKLFQFQEEDSIISMANFSLAKAVHPEFVASCEYLGTVGDSQPLHIYEMENLPGTAHVMARIPPDDMRRQCYTIKDLARNNDQRPCADDAAVLLGEFQSTFDLLARELPPRFASNLDRVRKALPSLFSGALPFILSHQDPNAMNLLINPESGKDPAVRIRAIWD